MWFASTWTCIILFEAWQLCCLFIWIVCIWVDPAVQTEYEGPRENDYKEPALCPIEDPTAKMTIPGSRSYFFFARCLLFYRYISLPTTLCQSSYLTLKRLTFHNPTNLDWLCYRLLSPCYSVVSCRCSCFHVTTWIFLLYHNIIVI